MNHLNPVPNQDQDPLHYQPRREFIYGALGVIGGVIVGATTASVVYELGSQPDQDKNVPEPAPVPLSPESDNQKIHLKWLPDTVWVWKDKIAALSHNYKVNPELPAIIMLIESAGNPMADSGVAKGLMQITDARASDIASKFLNAPIKEYDLFDPLTSIEFGIANIAHLIEEYGDSSQGPSWEETVSLVAAGYYAGEGGANYLKANNLQKLEAYDQGIYNYVRWVTGMWRERNDNKSFAYRNWHDNGGSRLIKAAWDEIGSDWS